MTMRELAKAASVSVSTVSKAFSDADDISYETKQTIFEIAKKHGVFGKYYKGKYYKRIIAIICPEISSEFYTTFVEKLQRIAEKNGAMVLISTDGFSQTKRQELIDYYASFLHVDGVFAVGRCDIKEGYDCPIISLLYESATVDSVVCDWNIALEHAVWHLVSLGHKRIGFISEPLTQSRLESYREFAKKLNIDSVEYVASVRFEQAGIDGIKEFFSSQTPPSAVICAYDYIAIGALGQLHSMGLSVPRDVSLIGTDNISVTEHIPVTLTTIDCKTDEMCDIAWELMNKKLNNPFCSTKQCIRLHSSLVIRDSTARI